MNAGHSYAEPRPEGRTPQACIACRRSKTKCCGTKPRCTRCTRRGTTCSWPVTNSEAPVAARRLETSSLARPETEHFREIRPRINRSTSRTTASVDADFFDAGKLRQLFSIFYTHHHDVEFCSFLHKPSVDVVALSRTAPFLVASIASLSSLYISQEDARSTFGAASGLVLSDHYAEKATTFSHSLSDTPSIPSVQAYLVLAIRELIHRKDFKAWMHAGTAIRMAQALHLGTESQQKHTARQKETRRRTFWACYVVDRLVSYSCNHAFTVSTSLACPLLPCPDTVFAFEEDGPGPSLDTVRRHRARTPVSQAGVLPFYIAMVSLWGDMAQLHIVGGRRRTTHAPTDPDGEFYRYDRAIVDFTAGLPASLRWSWRNYQLHEMASPGQAQTFVNFTFLLHHARCVMHHEYLPQLDSQYTLGGSVPDEAARRDAAGLPFEYANSAIVDPCMASIHAITDIAVALFAGSDHDRLWLQSTVVANALITAAAVHLWVVYTQSCDACPKDVARARFLQLLQITKSWEGQWPIASAWGETLAVLYKLYEYSYGAEPVPEFDAWESETDAASGAEPAVEETSDACGGQPDMDPAAVCQRLHDKVRHILVHPLHAVEVKKHNLRVFSRTLWRHMWLPNVFDGAAFDETLLDTAASQEAFYSGFEFGALGGQPDQQA